ncbi:DUF5684 domain-containing protein [Fulvivirgaceae bacterium BMA10]|uniref:DUF5684 domain-containing protein n=1 Tax=Splendidivirga corallicola TaxID=3051826 RepID=A0ABT8KJJ0_9BACT|nr:DUF5684 domain-containing protein [Fulvivirgaceae bacterium BMA10]
MESGVFFVLAFVIGLVVLMIASMWKIFEKAGKPGWAAIIPIYNTIILLEIAKKPWWWFLLMLIPYLGVIWSIWTWNMVVKNFGRTEGFTVGVILLSFIFIPILAFGDDKYIGTEAPSNPNILDANV